MKIQIDLERDLIIRASIFLEPSDDVFENGVPIDYSISNYDYIPETSGIYDPNGFYKRNVYEINNVIESKYIISLQTKYDGSFICKYSSGLFDYEPNVSISIPSEYEYTLTKSDKDGLEGFIYNNKGLSNFLKIQIISQLYK